MTKSFETNQQVYPKDHGEIVLYQRSDHKKPRWQARIKINGSKGYTKRSTGCLDEFEARRFAEALYEQLVHKFRFTGSTQTKTFESVVDEWLLSLKHEGKPINVIDEFRSRLYNYPVKLWTDVYIENLQDADLVAFLSWRKKNGKYKKVPSDATIKRDLVPLKQVFKYAYGKKYISRPLIFQSLNGKSERRPDFSEKEWNTILQKLGVWMDECKNRQNIRRDRIYLKYFVLLIGNTGIRPGTELKSLNWKSLTWQKIRGQKGDSLAIRIPNGKVGGRWVVPDKSVEGYLFELREYRTNELEKMDKPFNEDEPIFCHKDGKSIGSFKKGFRAFLEHYNLLNNTEGQPRVPYSLRHTFATRMIRNKKVSHWDLAKNMGTSVEELERHYVHDDYSEFGKDFVDSGSPVIRAPLDDW